MKDAFLAYSSYENLVDAPRIYMVGRLVMSSMTSCEYDVLLVTSFFNQLRSTTSQLLRSTRLLRPVGPVELIAYTEDVSEVFNRHGVQHHLYADERRQAGLR